MATNFIQAGKSLQIPAPSGGTVGGSIILVSDFVCVAETTQIEGEQVTLHLTGSYSGLPKKPTDTCGIGDKLYWDATNNYLTTTATSNTFAGWAWSIQGNTDSTVSLRLKL